MAVLRHASLVPNPSVRVPCKMTHKPPFDPTKGVLHVEWPLFGELARGLALKVARAFDPELVVGVATAGVVPGAVVAAMMGREFNSIVVSRRYMTDTVRETPAVFGEAPPRARGRRVLIVDETCDSGDTLRLTIAALHHAGAREIRTAVCIKRGAYIPDFHALATESAVILPWDREVIIDGELRWNPDYSHLV